MAKRRLPVLWTVLLGCASTGAPAARSGDAAPVPAADPLRDDPSLALDLRLEEARVEGKVRVATASYASAQGGRVPATFVAPVGDGPFPAVLLQHWGEGDRSEFADEARALAAAGIASLAIDAPWLRPEHAGKSLLAHSRAFYVQGSVDLLRGVEALASLPEVDPERLAFVGHSYGAHLGAIVLARAPRIRAAVLMAGPPSLSRMIAESEHPFWVKTRRDDPALVRTLVAELAPLDAERFIGDSRVPVLHQFGTRDEIVTRAMAEAYAAKTPAPKQVRWYDAGHALDDAARADRRAFLVEALAPAGP